MPFKVGVPELILILVLALLIFGPGRVGRLGGELGKGIRAFKDSLQDGKPKQKDDEYDFDEEESTEE